MYEVIFGAFFLWIMYRVASRESREREKRIKKQEEMEAKWTEDAVREIAKWKKEKGYPLFGREKDFYPDD